MAEKFTIKIDDISGGHAPYQNLGNSNQFQTSIGIDPDLPRNAFSSSAIRANFCISPSMYTTASGAELSGAPMWGIVTPKIPTGGDQNGLNNFYTYTSDGELITYTNLIASGAVLGTPTSGAGNGAAYYDNYIYLATPTDVSRWGPMNGTPSMTNTYWTSTLSKTALVNTTYPSYAGSIPAPNHPMHVHSDNALYFGDFKDGKGLIHKIKTSKSSVEGDTDDGSQYNVLDLPYGYLPTDIESYGEDLVISAIQTNQTILRQGDAAVFFWNTIDDSFYRQIPIKVSYVSALLNKGGVLYAFGSNANDTQIYKYLGGYSFGQVRIIDEGHAPYPGAVDYFGNRIVWGNSITFPEVAGCVMALGYKNASLPADSLNNIIRTRSGGTSPVVTMVKYAQQQITPRVVVGWKDGSGYGIDRLGGSDAIDCNWTSSVYNIGQKFRINKIRIPLSDAVAADMVIVPKVYVDDRDTTFTLKTINNTNYSGRKYIEYKADELRQNTSGRVGGDNNFEIELLLGNGSGTVALNVVPPITVEIELIED